MKKRTLRLLLCFAFVAFFLAGLILSAHAHFINNTDSILGIVCYAIAAIIFGLFPFVLIYVVDALKNFISKLITMANKIIDKFTDN